MADERFPDGVNPDSRSGGGSIWGNATRARKGHQVVRDASNCDEVRNIEAQEAKRVEDLLDSLMLHMEASVEECSVEDAQVYRSVAGLVLQDLALFARKHADYSPANIAASGEHGVLVRVQDKVARLRTLHRKGRSEVGDESVADTWADLTNYGSIARVCRRGDWPGADPRDNIGGARS